MSAPEPRPVRVLFVCQYNRCRSATAERVFCKDPRLDVRSAGTSADALVRVNAHMLEWADVVFIMEAAQQRALEARFPDHPALSRLITLDIPDEYDFLEPGLIDLLTARVSPHLMALISDK